MLTAGSILAFIAHTNGAPHKTPAHPHLWLSQHPKSSLGGRDLLHFGLSSSLRALGSDREEGCLGVSSVSSSDLPLMHKARGLLDPVVSSTLQIPLPEIQWVKAVSDPGVVIVN